MAWADDSAYQPLGRVDVPLGCASGGRSHAQARPRQRPGVGRRGQGGVTDAGLLAALQLGDSLFPSGGFTLSHGLETLAERRLIADAETLQAWIASRCAGRLHRPMASRRRRPGLLPTIWSRSPRSTGCSRRRSWPGSRARRRERTGRQTALDALAVAGGTLTRYRREVWPRRRAPAGRARAGRAAAWHRSARDGPAAAAPVRGRLHRGVAAPAGRGRRGDPAHPPRSGTEIAAAADEALAVPWKEMYACAVHTELMTMMHERATMRLFAS